MADAKIRLSVEGGTMVKSELDKVNAGLGGMANEAAFLKTTLLGLTGALSAGAFVGWARGMIDAADAVNDMSQRTGILVKDLAVFELAAKQSGTTMESISKGVKGLSGVMATNSEAMRAAGITATDTNGAMIQLANMFSKMPDGMEKTNLAVKVFGKSGMDLIPMLNMGSEGMQEATDKAKKYAEQMEKMAPMADAFNDNMAEIAMNSKIMGMSMMNDALPALNEITRAMADGSQKGGVLSGVMAGLAAGFENYKKGVREIYGMKPPSTGGATGSFAPDKPKVDESAPFRARIKELQDKLNGKGAAGTGAAEKISEYARLTQEITKTNAVSAQELLYGSKLAASDKYRVETMAKVEAAYVNNKISLLEKARLTEIVTAASAQMYLVEKQALQATIQKNNNDALNKINSEVMAIGEKNKVSREEIEMIGLSTEAQNALILSRMDSNIAVQDAYVKMLDGFDTSKENIRLIALETKKLEELKSARGLTGEKQAKTAFTSIDQQLNPVVPKYDAGEASRIIGAESEKQAAYNATARVQIDAYVAVETFKFNAIRTNEGATAKQIEDFDKLLAKANEMKEKLGDKFEIAVKADGLENMADQFSKMSATAGKMGDGFNGATKALSGFSSGLKTVAKAQSEQAKTGKDMTADQVGGYGEMAGAAKEMFDKNSAGYEVMAAIEKAMFMAKFAMQAQEVIGNMTSAASTTAKVAVELPAETALLTVKGANAVLNQGTGDPYTAFFRMAAMAAIVASVIAGAGGSSAGGGGGGGGGGSSSGGYSGNGSYAGTGREVTATGSIRGTRGSADLGNAESNSTDYQEAQQALATAESIEKMNTALRAAQSETGRLEEDLIAVKKATQGTGRAQHELATQGMSEAEVAAYNYNAAMRGQIMVLMDAANGTENASENMKSLANEAVNLAIDLKRAKGDITGANFDQMQLDTVGFSASEIAVYEHVQSLKAQVDAAESGAGAANDAAQAEADLAERRKDLQNQIDVLNGTSTQTQIDRMMMLAETTDEASLALMGILFGLEDLAAQKEIQNQIDILSGKTTQTKIDREKALISTSDESAKSLLNMLYGMQDLAEATAKAAEVAKALAAELIPAYQKFRPDAAFKYKSIAGELGTAGVGTGDVASWLGKATKDQIFDTAAAIYNMAGTTDTMRRAIVKAASALSDMKDEADTAALSFASKKEDTALAALTRSVDAQRKAATASNEVAKESADNLTSIFDMLDSNIKDLYGTVDATREQTMAQGAAFIDNALSTALATGYMPLANELSDALSSVRGGMGEKVYGSEIERKRDALVLAGKLSQLKDIAGPQLTTAELTLKAAEDQNKYLDSILEEAKAQIDVLRGIDTSVMSIADALLAFASQLAGSGAIRAGVSSTKPGDITNAEIAAHLAPRLGVSEEQNRNIYNDAFANRSRGVTLEKINIAGNLAPGTAEAWAIANGLPLFANGGDHSGGWAMVGERGPELAYMPPARIYNAGDTTRMMSGGDNSALIAELRQSNARLEARLQAIEKNTSRTAEAVNGNSARPMLVEVAV